MCKVLTCCVGSFKSSMGVVGVVGGCGVKWVNIWNNRGQQKRPIPLNQTGRSIERNGKGLMEHYGAHCIPMRPSKDTSQTAT
jgi:hypothetical protein